MSDAAEREGSHETPVQPPDEPQEASEPTADEVDLSEEEGFPDADPMASPVNVEPPAQATPGIYRCIGEVAGEHAVLGILTQGEEYDYSRVSDPRMLQAIAAYVELGVLEPVEASAPAATDEMSDHESSRG